MKNFKKVIFLSIIIIILIIYMIYNYLNEDVDEIIGEDVYIETNTSVEEVKKIILHITGEVKIPRNYKNR